MAVNLRGKSWTVTFRPLGQQIMLSLKGCESKRQAASIEAELTYAIQSKVYGGLTAPARAACVKLFVNQNWEMPEELAPRKIQTPAKVFTLWDAIELYVKDPSFKVLSKPVRYEEALSHLVKFFGKNRTFTDLWIPDLKLYRTHRSNQGVANSTINREISTLSGVFRVAIEHQVVEPNPCRLLKRLSEKSGHRNAYISLEDVQRIKSQSPNWFQDMIDIAYLSGMRKGEIHKLRWQHINLNKRIVTFHATETKEGQSKRVPIHRDLLDVFERIGKVRSLGDDLLFQIEGHPIKYDSLQHPWSRALDKLNWDTPRPRFHDLRHSWKTNARRSGIDHEIREMILGHSDRAFDVSERYGVISDDELVNAIDKFTYDNGGTQILVAAKAGK
ncbi:MAG: tyrosine-type recombinase/integrase [Desulfomonilaceae bacterium]